MSLISLGIFLKAPAPGAMVLYEDSFYYRGLRKKLEHVTPQGSKPGK